MSETMSGPENWLQFYQQPNLSTSQMSDSTIVATTVTSSTSMLNSPIGSGNNSSPNTGHLSPEGRVAKPIRRRSRASRRTPTTLLNTDTANFRAMVQQFTGGPSAPFASGAAHHGAPPSFGFALGPSRSQAHHHQAMMLPPTGHGFHLQPQQQLLYPHHHHHHQGQQQYMFSLGNNSSSNSTHHGQDHALLQRLGSSRPSSNMGSVGVSDGFVIEGGVGGVPSSSQVPPAASTVRPSNENRSNSFLF